MLTILSRCDFTLFDYISYNIQDIGKIIIFSIETVIYYILDPKLLRSAKKGNHGEQKIDLSSRTDIVNYRMM